MDLYLDNLPELEITFKKEAAFGARLSEGPENWPQELTSELMKQLPFLSDYEVAVNLDRVDPQRGFAFGYADVFNKTERPEEEHEESGLPHVRIPLIVMERAVKPFSIFLDGERVLPLNEERFREILFNPQTFDISNAAPRDPSLLEQLMPPQRSGFGMGGETKLGAAKKDYCTCPSARNTTCPIHGDEAREAKKGSSDSTATKAAVVGGKKKKAEIEKLSMLKAIAPTLRESDVESFVQKVAGDFTLQAGFKRSGVAPTLVEVFENTPRMSADERLQKVAASILPTVVTFQKLPGGDFLMKSGAVNAFAGGQEAKGQVVPEAEAAEAMGAENAQAMQPGQTATAVADPVEPAPIIETNEKMVEEFGEWLVQDTMGNRIMGWVFPKVLAWDGNFTPQDIALFTNGSAYAFQDAIAGELVGKSMTFPSDAPRGDGVFYSTEGGRPQCTAPITIGSSAAGPDGQARFMGTDVMGNQVVLSLQDGMKLPMRVADNEYALPSTWKFMRLNNQTELSQDPVQMNKAASVRRESSSVTLFYNGSYNLEGGCGLSKVARDLRYDLDPVSAEFMLGLLGAHGSVAKMKVAEARKKGSVKLAGLKTLIPLKELYQESVKVASALLEKVPNLRRDLIKEASAIDDAGTVDNLLSLNFINPENVAQFIGYLPELEVTSEKLAEMLLYSYLGMRELPEGAVERAMKNMEEVIQGLKALQHAEA